MTEATKNPSTETDSNAEVSATQVSAYLTRNPDFFENNKGALRALSIPHADTGKTVSLIERQVAALRAENKQLTQQLDKLIGNARTNDQLFDKAKSLVLDLISAQQISRVRELVEYSLRQDFGSTCCRLWLLSEQSTNSDEQLISGEDANRQLGRLVDGNKPFCGLLKAEECELLFVEQSSKVGSAAVLPLYSDRGLLAILAIANEDKNYYRDNMSTFLLTYIGEIVTRVIQQLSEKITNGTAD